MLIKYLTLYLIESPFNAFAFVRTTWSGSTLLLKYDIADPTQLDLTNDFFALCTNMKVYLYNYS